MESKTIEMKLENLSSGELFTLAKKKLAEEESLKPKVILSGNSSVNLAMISLAESYLKDIEDGREVDNHYAYEFIMESVYGNEIFTYLDAGDNL